MSLGLFGSLAQAQGEHARRVAAELLVIKGDLRELQNSELPSLHHVGLTDRIKGGLAGLDILMRYADQEANRTVESKRTQVVELMTWVEEANFQMIAEAIDKLAGQYALVMPTYRVTNPNDYLPLHQNLCLACHDNPNADVERPAYNLYKQAQKISTLEMFARMLVGVRGDRVTGVDNPLTDLQIVGLMQLYRSKP
jgi:hypothetical protein